MRALVQRVSRAQVRVDDQVRGSIGPGLLVFLGISRQATLGQGNWLANKVASLRIFPDENDRLNLSVKDTGGAVLVVSQFTLWADAQKGNRPSFSRAAGGEQALPLYSLFIDALKSNGLEVQEGEFGAIMQVELVNNGPITICLEAPPSL